MRHHISAFVALIGIALIVAGAIMNQTQGDGANVGAGFAIMAGLALLMAGLFSGALKALVPRSHRR